MGNEDRRCQSIDEKLRLCVPSQEMWKEWGVPDHVKVWKSPATSVDTIYNLHLAFHLYIPQSRYT